MTAARRYLLLALLFSASPGIAIAQSQADQSAVEVNTDVLNNIPGRPSAAAPSLPPVRLNPPTGQASTAITARTDGGWSRGLNLISPPLPLARPRQDSLPLSSAPPPPPSISGQADGNPLGPPAPAREEIIWNAAPAIAAARTEPKTATATTEPAPPARKIKPPLFGDDIQKFPIVTRTRSESTNPSLPLTPSRPVPKKTGAERIQAERVEKLQAPASPEDTQQAEPRVRINAEREPMNSLPGVKFKGKAPDTDATNHGGMKQPAQTTNPPANSQPLSTSSEDRQLRDMMRMDRPQVMQGLEDAARRAEGERAGNLPTPAADTPAADTPQKIVPPGEGPQLERIDSRRPGDTAPSGEPVIERIDAQPRQATIPKPTNSAPPADLRMIAITFAPDATVLDKAIGLQIDRDILPRLQANPSLHVQIQSFASENRGATLGARQRSLKRGLAARRYLIAKGIEQSRIDMRALGMQTNREPLDRIDFVFGMGKGI